MGFDRKQVSLEGEAMPFPPPCRLERRMTAAGTVEEVAHPKDNGTARQDGERGPEDLVEQSRYSSLDCSLLHEKEIHSQLM